MSIFNLFLSKEREKLKLLREERKEIEKSIELQKELNQLMKEENETKKTI